jgi:hypothetical protein
VRRGALKGPGGPYLAELAAELDRRGWRTRARDGAVLVVNPEVAELQELIGCRQDTNGWEFCWSWGEPLGPVTQIAEAADHIQRVLRTKEPVSREAVS